ncbi:MAG: orotate phosphoribosyltransferase [Methylobacter sp.]|nr:orotate phosphoribosyltransferase [Methylobacter sp.]
MLDYQKDFISYALDCGVLKFGEFELKSGRISPYFFNTGLFNTGAQLGKLGQFYAKALIQSGINPDILYGPAYKGIPLVSATSIAYAQITGTDIPFAFNRKEAKDHGEGGSLVGASLEGKVLILDDVITAGTSVRESVDIIKNAKAIPAGVLIALDRQEKGQNEVSAITEVEAEFTMPVIAIITLTDIIEYLLADVSITSSLARSPIDGIRAYQNLYGI